MTGKCCQKYQIRCVIVFVNWLYFLLLNFVMQVEAHEATINHVSDLCDVAESLSSKLEEHRNKVFIDLCVWESSPKKLMTILCEWEWNVLWDWIQLTVNNAAMIAIGTQCLHLVKEVHFSFWFLSCCVWWVSAVCC